MPNNWILETLLILKEDGIAQRIVPDKERYWKIITVNKTN